MLPQIAHLENELFPDDAWTLESIAELLTADINHVISLQKDGILQGYCLYQIVFETAEILRIGVNPLFKNQGIGSKILAELSQILTQKSVETLLLEVREDNLPAINFYQKQGFSIIHTRKNYYQLKNGQTVNALIMQKVVSVL